MKNNVFLLLALAALLFAGCGNGSTQQTTAPAATTAAASSETEAQETEATPDTIVIMAPPVTGNYLSNLKTWADDFHALHPNLTVEIIETSWGDHNDKLSTMAQAGEAPDIAEISSNALGTFVEMGVAIDIAQYMSADRLAECRRNADESRRPVLGGICVSFPRWQMVCGCGLSAPGLAAGRECVTGA